MNAASATLLLVASLAWSEPVIELDQHLSMQHLGGRMALLVDPSRALTAAQVAAPPWSERFHTATPMELQRGYSADSHWLRMTFRSLAPAPQSVFLRLSRTLDHAELYSVGPAGPALMQREGSALPFAQRQIPEDQLVFNLLLEPGKEQRYLLHVQGADAISLNATVWSTRAFVDSGQHLATATGVYYGVMLAMILYNLFVFLSLRERAYLFYVIFQVGFTLMQAALDRTAARYLFPEVAGWTAKAEIVFAGLALFGAIRFADEFLEIAAHLPRLHQALRLLAIGGILLLLCGLVSSHSYVQQAGSVFVIGASLSLLLVGILAWWRGSRDAPIFLVAWTALLLNNMVEIATATVASVSFALPVQTMRVLSVTEAMLLSLGLAARIRAVRRERDAHRSELERSRAAYTKDLEAQVAARTQEIAQALSSLRQAQDQLVRQARLATLGRLVAGLVHEMGNPLNFVLGGGRELARHLAKLRAAAPSLEPDADQALSRIERATQLVQTGSERIQRVVEGIRAWGSPAAAPLAKIDVLAELETVLLLVEDRLEKQGIRVHRDLEPLPLLRSRKGELGQVFLNLILNALQVMPDGGTLRITGRVASDQLAISITDSGPGVPAELRESIFDPFFTTRAAGEGMGLGLSISRDIVEWHGGKLTLLPEGPGATLLVTLPLPPPEP